MRPALELSPQPEPVKKLPIPPEPPMSAGRKATARRFAEKRTYTDKAWELLDAATVLAGESRFDDARYYLEIAEYLYGVSHEIVDGRLVVHMPEISVPPVLETPANSPQPSKQERSQTTEYHIVSVGGEGLPERMYRGVLGWTTPDKATAFGSYADAKNYAETNDHIFAFPAKGQRFDILPVSPGETPAIPTPIATPENQPAPAAKPVDWSEFTDALPSTARWFLSLLQLFGLWVVGNLCWYTIPALAKGAGIGAAAGAIIGMAGVAKYGLWGVGLWLLGGLLMALFTSPSSDENAEYGSKAASGNKLKPKPKEGHNIQINVSTDAGRVEYR